MFGHIHEAYGSLESRGTLYVNASSRRPRWLNKKRKMAVFVAIWDPMARTLDENVVSTMEVFPKLILCNLQVKGGKSSCGD